MAELLKWCIRWQMLAMSTDRQRLGKRVSQMKGKVAPDVTHVRNHLLRHSASTALKAMELPGQRILCADSGGWPGVATGPQDAQDSQLN